MTDRIDISHFSLLKLLHKKCIPLNNYEVHSYNVFYRFFFFGFPRLSKS